MKIAVYAIALNEAKHVKRFVKACKGADLIVVADTGSTDNTYKLFKDLGVEVHKIAVQPFRFDDARNAALALVPDDVDVCVSLDIDEIPSKEFFDEIRNNWKPETNRAWAMWDTGDVWANNNRVHARFGYRWISPCHEVTVWTKEEPENVIVLESTVKHEPDNSKSRQFYLDLLKLAVKEKPDDARMWAYLIREYYFNNDWNKIIDSIVNLEKLHTGWCVENSASYRTVAIAYDKLGNRSKSLEYYIKSTEEDPNSLEPWAALAQYYYEEKDWQNCYNASVKVLDLSVESDAHYLSEPSAQWRLYDLLGIASWNLGKKGSAKKYSRIAHELNPEDTRLKSNYYFMLGNNNGM